MDPSIGAMIVCDSSEQAKEVDSQLNRFSAYTHALVLYDEGTKQDRKNDQEKLAWEILIYLWFIICY